MGSFAFRRVVFWDIPEYRIQYFDIKVLSMRMLLRGGGVVVRRRKRPRPQSATCNLDRPHAMRTVQIAHGASSLHVDAKNRCRCGQKLRKSVVLWWFAARKFRRRKHGFEDSLVEALRVAKTVQNPVGNARKNTDFRNFCPSGCEKVATNTSFKVEEQSGALFGYSIGVTEKQALSHQPHGLP